jgi:DNA-binding transcriptional ArsR family regulator
MKRSRRKAPQISSFAAPPKADIAVFDALPDEERRRILEAEIESGLRGAPRNVTAEDIIAAVDARLADA